MEVQFTPDLQAKLDKLAIDTGRAACELVEDAGPDILMSWPRRAQCLTAGTTT